MLPGRSYYLIGRDRKSWHTVIRTFQKVRFAGAYPCVDLAYHGDQSELQYDFIVAAKADPSIIAATFEGANSLTIDRAGDLVVGLPRGSVRQYKPCIYREVNGACIGVGCLRTETQRNLLQAIS